MKYIKLILLSALLLTFAPAFGQNTDDYKIQKAYEVLQEDKNEEKALGLLREVLKSSPDNVEALQLRARIYRNTAEYGYALTDLNRAIKVNKPKKSGIVQSYLYFLRAAVYSTMKEKERAAADYGKAAELARKDDREKVASYSFFNGWYLGVLERYTESDAVYSRMLREDDADVQAMLGLAYNQMKQERYTEAVQMFDKAQMYDSDFADIYRYRMEAYDKMGEADKAIDDGIEYGEKDNNCDLYRLIDIMSKHHNYAVARLKSKIKTSEKAILWRIVLAVVYEKNYDFASALKEYESMEKDYGFDKDIHDDIANCYDNLGLTDKAIECISFSMAKDPTYFEYCTRGDFYRALGQYDKAIADFTSAIEEKPDEGYGYYKRGWCYELSGDLDKAMEDYGLGIDIDSDYAYIRLNRGEVLLIRGEKEKAEADFQKILQIDTLASSESCRMYALHFLGRDEEAAEWMQKMIDADPDNCGNYYDKACLYTRMGRYDEAVEAFKKCLEMGYSAYAHIENDDDLDPIREREDFKAALSQAKERTAAQAKDYEKTSEEAPKEEEVHEIALTRHASGTFEVPCEINGLPLKMIFDTGASDVTISSVEANFMLKNDYLSSKDIKGKRYYQVANGSLSEGTVITLREVKIGDAVLHNVEASVVNNQRAPLLFGQSAMEKFGTITIDNQSNKLIIKR